MSFYIRIFFFATWLCAADLFARYSDDDINEVDAEQRLNSENYNDEFSYRPPFSYMRLWERYDLGLRVNGGSYNARRFMYEEDIKLSSSKEKPATFSFYQERQQDLLGNVNQSELRITLNTMKPFYFAFMGDGDSYKRSADFGLSLALRDDTVAGLEVYAWTVNHLYNKKRGDTKNEVMTPTRTLGAKAFIGKPNDLRLNLHAEVDSPLYWDLVTDGYEYRYFRRQGSASLEIGDKYSGWFEQLRYFREYKEEEKLWHLGETADLTKGMQRHWTEMEFVVNYAQKDQYDFTQGVVLIERNVDYTWQPVLKGINKLPVEPEAESPNTMRHEFAYYATFFSGKAEGSGYQFGLFANYIYFHENGHKEYRNEIKLQTAWNYAFSESVQSLLSGTWNLDGLVVNYPYTDRPFRPWDGGALQIIAMF